MSDGLRTPVRVMSVDEMADRIEELEAQITAMEEGLTAVHMAGYMDGQKAAEADAIGTLVFMNADATPKNVSIQCKPESVPPIMAWYGAYFAGDRYTAAFNGRNIWMDINGECLNTLAELTGGKDD